ncbi:MAG: hypothetical protein K8M05_30915 [Deltaproteobacteria bacterium]|nr:hypothetical protein [Kofleriaceae bacterium]
MKRIDRKSSPHRVNRVVHLELGDLRAVTGGADRDPPRDIIYDPDDDLPPPARPSGS